MHFSENVNSEHYGTQRAPTESRRGLGAFRALPRADVLTYPLLESAGAGALREATAVHFNFLVGDAKKRAMQRWGLWFRRPNRTA